MEYPTNASFAPGCASSFRMRRTSYGRLPFSPPVGPYWAINKSTTRTRSYPQRQFYQRPGSLSTPIQKSRTTNPDLFKPTHGSQSHPLPSIRSQREICVLQQPMSTSHSGPVSAVNVSKLLNTTVREAPGIKSSIERPVQLICVENTSTSLPLVKNPLRSVPKSSLYMKTQQNDFPSYLSPTTVKHNVFGSSRSPSHGIRRPNNENTTEINDEEGMHTTVIAKNKPHFNSNKTSNCNASNNRENNSSSIGNIKRPSPSISPLRQPRPSTISSPPIPSSPQQHSLSHSANTASVSGLVGDHSLSSRPSETQGIPSISPRSGSGDGSNNSEQRERFESASMRVLPNALSIRRSRRARRHTLRSLTPSPPRQESNTDLLSWPSNRQ